MQYGQYIPGPTGSFTQPFTPLDTIHHIQPQVEPTKYDALRELSKAYTQRDRAFAQIAESEKSIEQSKDTIKRLSETIAKLEADVAELMERMRQR